MDRNFALADNPKEQRKNLRAQCEEAFYVSVSGKCSVRTLHQLGSCYAIPGIDYVHYNHVGTSMPLTTEFDAICKVCSSKLPKVVDLSDSESSSSTAEPE